MLCHGCSLKCVEDLEESKLKDLPYALSSRLLCNSVFKMDYGKEYFYQNENDTLTIVGHIQCPIKDNTVIFYRKDNTIDLDIDCAHTQGAYYCSA